MPSLIIAVCISLGALPIPFNYGKQHEHVMVVVPNYLADVAVHEYAMKDGKFYRQSNSYFGPLLADLNTDEIIFRPKGEVGRGSMLHSRARRQYSHLMGEAALGFLSGRYNFPGDTESKDRNIRSL
jgi:hypothetical protein